MQKKFKIEVDCANCAAKIETAIKALPGVKNASAHPHFAFTYAPNAFGTGYTSAKSSGAAQTSSFSHW